MASSSSSGSSTPGQPGSFKPLGAGVWDGFIDSNNIIRGRWVPAAQELITDSIKHLATDEANAKKASERSAYETARHLHCTAIVIRGSWHPGTTNTISPDQKITTADPTHLTLEASGSTKWSGRFKVHTYLPPSAQGNNIFKDWKLSFGVFIVTKGFCKTLSTIGEVPKGFENNLVEPQKKQAPPPAKPAARWTPPPGAKPIKSMDGKTSYWASADDKKLWDKNGKAIAKPK